MMRLCIAMLAVCFAIGCFAIGFSAEAHTDDTHRPWQGTQSKREGTGQFANPTHQRLPALSGENGNSDWMANPASSSTVFHPISNSANPSLRSGSSFLAGEQSATNAEGNGRKISPPGRAITPPGQDAETGKTPGGSIWSTIGGLAIVVTLILIVAKIWKKNGKTLTGGLPTEVFERLGRSHLDHRQSVHLVRLGSRILVIGSSADGLRTLAEISDPVEVDYLAGLCRHDSDQQTVVDTFRNLFQRTTTGPGSVVPSGRGSSGIPPMATERSTHRDEPANYEDSREPTREEARFASHPIDDDALDQFRSRIQQTLAEGSPENGGLHSDMEESHD